MSNIENRISDESVQIIFNSLVCHIDFELYQIRSNLSVGYTERAIHVFNQLKPFVFQSECLYQLISPALSLYLRDVRVSLNQLYGFRTSSDASLNNFDYVCNQIKKAADAVFFY